MLGIVSLALCFLIINFPGEAFIYCNVLSIAFLMVSSVWQAYALSISQFPVDVLALVRIALIVLPVIISAYIIIHFFKEVNRLQAGARCILAETSMCLERMHKILVFGYLDVLSCIVSVFLLSVAFRYTYNCQKYTVVDGRVVSESTYTFFLFEWMVVPAFGIWLVTTVKITLATIVAHSVASWFFSEKKDLERGRMGFRTMLSQLGAVVGCSWNGYAIHTIVTGLFVFAWDQNHTPIIISFDREATFTIGERIIAYFSPYTPAAIGVFGDVQPTIISYQGRIWSFPRREKLKQLQPKSHYQRLIIDRGIGWIVQKSHAVLRWYLWWLQVSLAFMSITVYCVLQQIVSARMHVLEMDLLIIFLVAFYGSGSFFNVLYVAIDATVLCFTLDMSLSHSDKNPFYSSNDMIYGLTNSRLIRATTYGEIEKKIQMETETRLIKEKIRRRLMKVEPENGKVAVALDRIHP
jgi:hypothetical protein